ncbi:hypothetical protein BJ138DRAFT_1126756 [Hygrophoropsis aurantiaca]|uniref:Uncharacterized protein n=1 Tax=Hygrophoropsis aurantiaca TaxID=72124 RepID=A0ACB8AD03_9AGAM|nr:hypothetical protein BJ138DRAFT_1126756 [Hygrophoropsis aurantiaca]
MSIKAHPRWSTGKPKSADTFDDMSLYTHSPSSSQPRPILKRQQTSPEYHRALSPDRLHAVHFPPSPTLTRTFTAHSPTAYDRSPIVVAPNTCALPERGCPGRTYVLGGERPMSSSPPKRRSQHGIHLHPRAVSNPISHQSLIMGANDDDPQRTPTRTAPMTLPPLIPDLSSESDESDGFVSPPPEFFNTALSPAPSIPRPRARGDPIMHSNMSSYDQHGYANNSLNIPSALSFLPYPPSPDDANKARRRRQRDRSRERERERESKYGPSNTSEEKDEEVGYKSLSLCRGLSNCSFDNSEDGCLGGF